MTPFEVLVFAVSLGSSLGLFLYFIFRSCINALKLSEHKKLTPFIYVLSPLFGLDLVLVLYYGISTIALTFVVGCILSVLVAFLVGLSFYLSFLIFCQCLSSSAQHIFALCLSTLITSGTAVGIFFVIKPHIPVKPQSLSLESSGAAVLGGLIVFGGVGIFAYLCDKIYRHTKKGKSNPNMPSPQLPTKVFENFQKDIEEVGFMIVAPEKQQSFEVLDPTPTFEEKTRGPGYSLEEIQIGQVGDKRITLTVEDPTVGSVYNFELLLSPQVFKSENGYQRFKSAALAKCLNYNININDLEFRRYDGRRIQTDLNFWEDLSNEEMFLALVKS